MAALPDHGPPLHGALAGPTSRIYFSQRLRLHYVDWGNLDAPPLLLVHGGRDHCRNWDWVAQRLRKDYHIIAPDLRGHGDSEWSATGQYQMAGYIYDLAQLIHQQKLAPVTIIAHSLGGNISLRYTGIYPESVKSLVAIEGLGPSPKVMVERRGKTIEERMHSWIEDQRRLSGRLPRRYPTLEDAFNRMHEENKHLSPEQARHLTQHGINQNEDGTYSWKFDNYVRSFPPYDMRQREVEELWSRITCPTLLVYGKESWASNPEGDGRVKHFKSATVASVEKAGHWVHHDQLDIFMGLVNDHLKKTGV
jgi:pimeloyl-ACP methyl ester carboxylesterase